MKKLTLMCLLTLIQMPLHGFRIDFSEGGNSTKAPVIMKRIIASVALERDMTPGSTINVDQFLPSITLGELRNALVQHPSLNFSDPKTVLIIFNGQALHLDLDEKTFAELERTHGFGPFPYTGFTLYLAKVPESINRSLPDNATDQQRFAQFKASIKALHNIDHYNHPVQIKFLEKEVKGILEFFNSHDQKIAKFSELYNKENTTSQSNIQRYLTTWDIDHGKLQITEPTKDKSDKGESSTLVTPRNALLALGGVGLALAAWKWWQRRQAKKKEQARKRMNFTS